MNKERVQKYINVLLNHIETQSLHELEEEINMPISIFLMEIIEYTYNKYIPYVSCIPVSYDNYSDYIIAPKNGKYSLEDFLLNRLLRNITSIIFRDESSTIAPDSHYQYEFGEVLIDMDRLKNDVKDVRQKRKIVGHEIFHALKTQFLDGDIFEAERYYEMKEVLKGIFGSEINDFSMRPNQQNTDYKHSGVCYGSRFVKENPNPFSSIDLEILDEVLNELDAICATKDNYQVVYELLSNGSYLMVSQNPESSNSWITNYAFILEKLLDDETLFVGLYLEPERFCKDFNTAYSHIFQSQYSSDLSAIEILLEQLRRIKDNPKDIDRHIQLLTCLYHCVSHRFVMCDFNEKLRDASIRCLANKGLLYIENNRLHPLKQLPYYDEFENVRDKRHS